MATTAEVKDKLISVIAVELQMDRSLITDDSTIESLAPDELDRVELVFGIEQEFSVKLDEDDAVKTWSVSTTAKKIVERSK